MQVVSIISTCNVCSDVAQEFCNYFWSIINLSDSPEWTYNRPPDCEPVPINYVGMIELIIGTVIRSSHLFSKRFNNLWTMWSHCELMHKIIEMVRYSEDATYVQIMILAPNDSI